MERASVVINGLEVFVDMIKRVTPTRKAVVIVNHPHYVELADNQKDPLIKYGIFVTIIEPEIMSNIEFEYIKHIKKNKNPEDRVADFEWHCERNIPDFAKLDRMIERRKTRSEKQKEIQDELEWKEIVENHGLEYIGPLMEMLK